MIPEKTDKGEQSYFSGIIRLPSSASRRSGVKDLGTFGSQAVTVHGLLASGGTRIGDEKGSGRGNRSTTIEGKIAGPRDGCVALLYDGQLYLHAGDRGCNKLDDLFVYKY